MAATKGKLTEPQRENIRQRIKTDQLIKRLQGFALGEKENNPNGDGERKEIEIDPNRLRAIEILLRKALPDLQAVTLDGNVGMSVTLPKGSDKL